MVEQFSFPPAQGHSVTSVNAASAIAEHAPKMRERVYAEICKWPGTDQELAHRLELSENSVRPRRVELQRQGKVKAVSKRNTLSGRQATVWGAT